MSSPAEAGCTLSAGIDALRLGLLGLGVDVDVSADGAMAVLRVTRAGDLPRLRELRSRVVETARASGFTHVAVELALPDGTSHWVSARDAHVRRAEPLA